MAFLGVSFTRHGILGRVAPLAVILSELAAGLLSAQTTSGKLEGTVRDQAGSPIANAQVFVVGTTFAATTNADGYYFLNSVPIGTRSLQASFIGYKATRVEGLMILSNQTLTQDVTLEATPFEVEEITVVAAVNPLVPRDEVTTKQRLDGDYSKNLPVDVLNQVLMLQPGVVASTSGRTLFIRGGRADEAALYIDGVPAQAGSRNSVELENSSFRAGRSFGPTTNVVAVNAFEQASITTGAIAAEFGNAQSGIIAIETRSGGRAWAGSLSYETNDFSNKYNGLNLIRGSISGPITGGLTFFLGGDLAGNQSTRIGTGKGREQNPILVQAGTDTTVAVASVVGDPLADTAFVDIQKWAIYTGKCDAFSSSTNPDIAGNYGQECRGVREPGTTNSFWRLTTNLNWSYGAGSRIKASAIFRQAQGRFWHPSNPIQVSGERGTNAIYTLNWTQNLAKSAERALALEVGVSYQQDRYLRSPLTRSSEASTYSPFGGFILGAMDFVFDRKSFPINDELIDNFRNNNPGSRRGPYDLENTDQYSFVREFRTNPYGLAPLWSESGGPTGRLRIGDENRIVARATLDWQVDRFNRVKFGGEYTDYEITEYSSSLIRQVFSTAYIQKPIRYNLFVQDRLDLGDVVLEGGLRFDYYDSKAERPFLLDLEASSPTFNEYVFFPRTSSYQGTAAVGQGPADCSATGCPLTVFRRDQTHDYLSPHIQVAFPVTRQTNFRLSYAHQVQAPDFALVYAGLNTDLSITNTNNSYGSDLDFGRTIIFELGLRHSFNQDMVLDVSAYNKDNLSNAAGRLVPLQDPLRETVRDVRLLTNADFGNTKGIDIRLDKRIGTLFNGTLAFTFEDAKNTGSDPFSFIDFGSRIVNAIGGGASPPPQAILPTDQSRPQTLAGSFSLQFPNDWKQGTGVSWLENAGLFATFRFASGTAFTRCSAAVRANATVLSNQGACNGNPPGGINTARLPMLKQFNLRVTKGFGLGGVDVTAYADIRNLFNFTNTLVVYSVTNDINSAVAREDILSADLSSFESEAQANGAMSANGDVLLPSANGACADWLAQDGASASPSCMYLIRAEQRYGDGDRVFSVEEQSAASMANFDRTLGAHAFRGPGRQVRLGVELNF